MQQYQSGTPVVASHQASAAAAALAHAGRPAQGPGAPAGGPPMTASVRRPVSALRRAGAALAEQPGQGVQVDFRPVTQHGMTGMRPATQGGGRQLADSSFFVAALRNKITEVTDELAVLQAELDARLKDQSANSHLERKYDEMSQVIHDLEGHLADYNLTLDKVRTGTDLRDLNDRCQRMTTQNDQLKQQVDDVFMSRSTQDTQRAKLDEEIALITRNEEACLTTAPADLQRTYRQLKEEAAALQADLARKEEQHAEGERLVKEHESMLSRDEYRVHLRGLEMQRELKELEEQRRELRDDCDANLTVDQMRERLQNKAKEDAVIVKTMEERLRALQDEIQHLHEAVHEREAQKENMKEFEEITKKYEALYQRDKAMQEFIDKFEVTKQRDAEQKRQIQARIVALMEHISDSIVKKENLPNSKQVSAMEHDLTFKSKELDASQVTLERVKKELDKRREEMEQVNGLSDKIRDELVSLASRAAEMQNEMGMLNDIEGLKTREAQTKQQLLQELAVVKHKRAAIQVQVQALTKQYDAIKKRVADDEDWKRLETLESKLRTYAQTTHALETHIAARKRECDFEPIRDQVVALVAQVNSLLVAQHSS
ncbi:Uncharacterized protein PBTT_00428 [Plasmodiophora brassicae]|nr:hypothetical protein PBRA_004757 [Plasmodiophora brassicae]